MILCMATTVAAGCEIVSSVKGAVDSAGKIMGNINKAIEDVSSAAKNASSQSLNGAAKIPAIPSKVTGGRDLTAASEGQSGQSDYDIDGDGDTETLEVFTDNAGVTFLYWEDELGCWLAWIEGTVLWTIWTECGSDEGVFVCSGPADDFEVAQCQACNADGACEYCTEQDEECDWPPLEEQSECEQACDEAEACDLDVSYEDCLTDCEADPQWETCLLESASCDQMDECDGGGEETQCEQACQDAEDCDLGFAYEDCLVDCEADPGWEACLLESVSCEDMYEYCG